MDKKIVNISSFGRIDSLEKTIQSIYNQCDEVNVCLNDKITELPNFLLQPKINLTITDNSKGDAFKFLNLENSDGYYLTIDDDLIYPPNYVDYMISNCKKYNNKKIITLHGRKFNKFPITSYYNSKKEIYHFSSEQKQDVTVQYGGTGVMCFHTSLLKTPIEYFQHSNMADVWIGNLAKIKNIEIICISRPKNFITQIEQKETIYNHYSNNDKIQTNLVNLVYNIKNLSIIIPTYKNTQYIDECLNSIIESSQNQNVEVLVGIDGCEETLQHIKNKTYPDYIRFYYFQSNNGPYDIKNTLTQISNSDNLLFFDSDDIMTNTTINDIVNNLVNFDVVRLRYNLYLNGEIIKKKQSFGEGVFAIKKNIFLSMNGFEPWMVAADSDFIGRLYKRNVKTFYTNNVCFLYRQHTKSLTKRPDTGLSSRLRGNYATLSKNKKGNGNPPILNTRNFEFVSAQTFVVPETNNFSNEIRNQKLDSIFNRTTRKQVEASPQKKPDPVILDRLDFLYNNKPEPVRIIKTNKPSDRQELINKKNGTTKSTIKEMFSIKPNHREGKNFINFGGKFKK
jgi:glycosyltransferase involved in cell wall biosynthesis